MKRHVLSRDKPTRALGASYELWRTSLHRTNCGVIRMETCVGRYPRETAMRLARECDSLACVRRLFEALVLWSNQREPEKEMAK